jgi:2'-5' RNA ligase
LRLFTAIDIPADVRAALASLLDRLRPLAKLHWIPVEKLHVTTKFIGEWPEERLEELKRALGAVTGPAPVDVAIRRVGWLPNPRSARMLYAGVEASAGGGSDLSPARDSGPNAQEGLAERTETRTFRNRAFRYRILPGFVLCSVFIRGWKVH